MICYKDKTFCSFYKECRFGKNCDIALNDYVLELATKWSKQFHPTDVLVSQYVSIPDCFEKI